MAHAFSHGTYKTVKARCWPWLSGHMAHVLFYMAHIRQSGPDTGRGCQFIWHILSYMAHIRQSRPYYCLGFQVLKTFFRLFFFDRKRYPLLSGKGASKKGLQTCELKLVNQVQILDTFLCRFRSTANSELPPLAYWVCSTRSRNRGSALSPNLPPYRGASPIRNIHPPSITIGPYRHTATVGSYGGGGFL
jgi:hypothetical protein